MNPMNHMNYPPTMQQDNRVIVEKHYIPLSLYRELYINHNNSAHNHSAHNHSYYTNPYHNPYTNPYTNPYAYYNYFNRMYPPIYPTTYQNYNQSQNHNPLHTSTPIHTPATTPNATTPDTTPSTTPATTPNPTTMPALINMNTPHAHVQNIINTLRQSRLPNASNFTTSNVNINPNPNMNANPIINTNILPNNLIHDLLSRNTPFDIQISNIMPSMRNIENNISGIIRNFNFDAPESSQNAGIPLSNINTFTTVSRYCDLEARHNHNRNHNHLESETSNDMCSICQVPYTPSNICRLINNCNHYFHIECIDIWLNDHLTCPCCRYNLTTNTDSQSNVSISNPSTIPISISRINLPIFSNLDNEEELGNGEDNYQHYSVGYGDDGGGYGDADGDADGDDDDDNFTDYGNYENYDYQEYDDEYDDSFHNSTTESPMTTDTPNNFSQPRIIVSSILPEINSQPVFTDINNFVNIATPILNSFMTNTSNTTPLFNAQNINSRLNSVLTNAYTNITPIIQAFDNLRNNATSNSSPNIYYNRNSR